MRGLEFVPSLDFAKDLENLKAFLTLTSLDFILVPDNPLNAPKPSAIVCAKLLQDGLQIKTIACISGKGKDVDTAKSLLLGAKYANLSGVALVSAGGLSALSLLDLAKDLGFEFVVCTPTHLEQKQNKGANLFITQPLYAPPFPTFPILPNLMPIFSRATFESLLTSLDFSIPQSYRESPNLWEANLKLFENLTSFYLTPLNLKKQMPHFKRLFSYLT